MVRLLTAKSIENMLAVGVRILLIYHNIIPDRSFPDGMLALRTWHELKRDSERAPFIGQKLSYTVSVKYVTAGEFNDRLSIKLTSEANRA